MSFRARVISRIAKTATVLAAGFVLTGLAQAQLVYLTATLNGAQETPPTPTPATGLGCYTFDTSTNIISYNITFAGLLGPENAAHFHQGAPGVAGPVIVGLPPGSPKIGSAPLTAAQAAALLAGNIYTNIHSNVFPGGEIRGQMIVIPPPTLFCFGDGSSGPCPCGNTTPVGNNEGCMHSAGFGGKLVASGGSSIACDSLQLCASQMLGSNCIFLQGSTAPFGPVFFGDGERCIGGTLKRLGITPISAAGPTCLGGGGSVGISILGAITGPGTVGYQVYFRDPNPFCTAFTYNITNGALVNWVP